MYIHIIFDYTITFNKKKNFFFQPSYYIGLGLTDIIIK